MALRHLLAYAGQSEFIGKPPSRLVETVVALKPIAIQSKLWETSPGIKGVDYKLLLKAAHHAQVRGKLMADDAGLLLSLQLAVDHQMPHMFDSSIDLMAIGCRYLHSFVVYSQKKFPHTSPPSTLASTLRVLKPKAQTSKSWSGPQPIRVLTEP